MSTNLILAFQKIMENKKIRGYLIFKIILGLTIAFTDLIIGIRLLGRLAGCGRLDGC